MSLPVTSSQYVDICYFTNQFLL